jgi:hypothetical protein
MYSELDFGLNLGESLSDRRWEFWIESGRITVGSQVGILDWIPFRTPVGSKVNHVVGSVLNYCIELWKVGVSGLDPHMS